MNEFNHRCHLFVALMRSHPKLSWRANDRHDGSNYASWFIAGMRLPTGNISYYLPVWMWEMLDRCEIETSLRAPEDDVPTPAEIIRRLEAWFHVNSPGIPES